MRYSDDIIEEVRMKNDIVDVVSQYVKLTRKGSSYFGLCPFHNEKTPSFSASHFLTSFTGLLERLPAVLPVHSSPLIPPESTLP